MGSIYTFFQINTNLKEKYLGARTKENTGCLLKFLLVKFLEESAAAVA